MKLSYGMWEAITLFSWACPDKYSRNKHPQSQVGDGSKMKVGDISVVIKSDVEMTEPSDESDREK